MRSGTFCCSHSSSCFNARLIAFAAASHSNCCSFLSVVMSDNRHTWALVPSRTAESANPKGQGCEDSEAKPVASERNLPCPRSWSAGASEDRGAACDEQNCLKLMRLAMVPLAGLEPARCRHQQILSLPRLPIPPQGQGGADHSGPWRGVNGRPIWW